MDTRTIARLQRAARTFKRVKRLHSKYSLDWMVAIRRVRRLQGDHKGAAMYSRIIGQQLGASR